MIIPNYYCRKPKFLKSVLKEAEKLLKLHPFYLKIKMGKKILKVLKRIRVRRIVKNVGKKFRRVGETIGKTWKSINRNVRRTLRKIKGAVRVRVRRLVRVRVRLPRVRLPRVRVRLPRVRVPRVRVRVRVGRRWGKKKKRSSCSDCERISNIKDEETLSKTCSYYISYVIKLWLENTHLMMLILYIGGRFKVRAGGGRLTIKFIPQFSTFILCLSLLKTKNHPPSPTLHTHNPVSTPMLIF